MTPQELEQFSKAMAKQRKTLRDLLAYRKDDYMMGIAFGMTLARRELKRMMKANAPPTAPTR